MGKVRARVIVFFVLSIFLCSEASLSASKKAQEIDKNIINRISEKLSHYGLSQGIAIDSREGVVTVSGRVSNILIKDTILSLTQTAENVLSVIDMLKTEPPTQVNQSQIKKNVIHQLEIDSAAKMNNIAVDVTNNIVVLTGTVESWAKKQLIEEIVKGIDGVMSIENDLEINTVFNPKDYEIKSEILRSVYLDPFLRGSTLDVDVKDKKVTISGSVNKKEYIHRVLHKSWVDGVSSVDVSNIKLTKKKTPDMKQEKIPDETIALAIKDSFKYNPRVYFFDIEIKVEQGNVTLSGEVDNLKAKIEAEKSAIESLGVIKVANGIQVFQKKTSSDHEISKQIKDSFSWDSVVNTPDIKAFVKKGNVRITGHAINNFEKERAEDVASRVAGVKSIQNELLVTGTLKVTDQ